jgi:hypothetical protein
MGHNTAITLVIAGFQELHLNCTTAYLIGVCHSIAWLQSYIIVCIITFPCLSHYVPDFGGCLHIYIYSLFDDVGSTDYKRLIGSAIRELIIGNMWNEVAVVYFEVPSWNLPSRTEENYKKPQDGQCPIKVQNDHLLNHLTHQGS